MTSNAQDTRDDYDLDAFITDVGVVVATGGGERHVTEEVAARLRRLLAAGLRLPGELTVPRAERYVMRPLHVDPDGAFSVACAVWDVGQSTPVHGHETWGVVGIHSGVEREVDYVKPVTADEPLAVRGEADWGPGEVTVCCTTDDDVHQVECGSDVPCVGIHVYGADIGTLPRRSYEPETGRQSWFVSTWG
ncbi:cysteine dioxygenase family protein [Prauserella cavernicola]|uniref:Cysteine dioxygenase family protein n=1 Tax=Prauserella cavernicola TaxID=2800127 RepID=A0A934QW12_9PSEU|nr:cysteine dioxygenase family protein [Prauserella cavernicola]MBK1786634.1 cysteine dioxygenase family protein [Prauserella cavernicola]